MSVANPNRLLFALNLLVPGGGLILLGRLAVGVTTALVFAAAANTLIVGAFILPAEIPWLTTVLAALAASVSYLSAQLLFVSRVRDHALDASGRIRADALRDAAECLKRGDGRAGLERLNALGDSYRRDLLVAYRRAQLLGLTGDAPAARAAWQVVRILDRHGIYRRTTADALRALDSPSAMSTTQSADLAQ